MALGALFYGQGDMRLQIGVAEGQLGMPIIGVALGVHLSLIVASTALRAI